MDNNGSSLVLQSSPSPHGAAPPPAYSRLPPDGHEFPPNFCEPADIGAFLIKNQLRNTKNAACLANNNNNNNHNNSRNTTEMDLDIDMEKKHSYVDTNSIITTLTTTTTSITTTNMNNNHNEKKSRKGDIIGVMKLESTMDDNEKSAPTLLPPPLPKTVPPPPVTKPRKIFREKLVVNIEDARERGYSSPDNEDLSSKTTPHPQPSPQAQALTQPLPLPLPLQSKYGSDNITVMPRRSSSTQSLTAIASAATTMTMTTTTSSSGGSTPTAHKPEQPDFQLREQSKRSWATRKPSNWHKDEKSERSVRDKIAMFSMDDSGSSISGSTPHLNLNSNGNSGSNSRRSLNWSSENLLETNSSANGSRIGAFPTPPGNNSNLTFMAATNGSSVINNSNNNIGSDGGEYFGRAINDIFATRALSMENLYAAPSENSSKQQQHQKLSKYSESLQSLDTMPSYYASLPRRHVVHPQQLERRISFSGGQMSEEASRKVANLLEHRRRSITKLRGLVIPERPSTLEPILDLPEIKSRDSEQTNISDYSTDSGVVSGGSNSSGGNSAVNPSATTQRATKRIESVPRAPLAAVNNVLSPNELVNANTNYRSIFGQQRVASTLPAQHRGMEPPPQPPAKPPRTSLSTLSTVSPTSGSVRPPALLPHDESDSDSVFSSKVSSPPMSPMGASLGGSITTTSHSSIATVVPEKFALTRTLSSETNTSIASSTTSTLTSGSGSQASCSSVGSTPTVDLSRRIIKSTHTASNANSANDANVVAAAAAASRKNILASAKCRSGRGESSLLRQRSHVSYHDDEDSTDGYDEEEVRRVAHKTRSRNNLTAANSFQSNATTGMLLANSLVMKPQISPVHAVSPSHASVASSTVVNYKLVSKNLATTASANTNANSIVDGVINVAAYVEVTTTASDTDDSSHKSDAANATSPSKISAIFIDEERKASFKAPNADVDATPEFDIKLKSNAVKSPTLMAPCAANAEVVNAMPVKTVIAQQARTPLMSNASPKTPLPMCVPTTTKRTTNDGNGNGNRNGNGNGSGSSNEIQQWVQLEMAKSTNTKSLTGTPERSLKPVLAKFERASGTGANTTVVASKHVTKPMTSTAELRERFERNANATSKPNLTKTNAVAASGGTTGTAGSSYLDRFSSLDSVASSSSGVSSSTQNVSSTHEHNDFGSFSSLGSNQSLITAQDLWQIMEEADPPLKNREAFIVVLQRDTPESTVGITLAGGADYETKEVTVNKVLAESPAARDGRLRKGDRILAVNGMSMRGLTHNESVSVLKTPRPEVTLVVTRSESLIVEAAPKKRYTLGSLTSLLEKPNTEQQLEKKQRKSYHSASRSLDIGLDSVATTNENENSKENNSSSNNLTLRTSSSSSTSTPTSSSSTDGAALSNKQDEGVSAVTASTLVGQERKVIVCKDYCGLGFSLEGGFDSPLGNRPLLIRKVFYGGAAHKTGQIKPGDEIIAINGLSTAKMTRIEVWNYMNQLPVGNVEMVLL